MGYHFADCVLDDAAHSLARGGHPVPVEPLVFDLLHLLVRHAGELVTRDLMIEEIWDGRIISDSAITACVFAARKAVGDDGKRQAIIKTVARRGLMLIADLTVSGTAGAVPSREAPTIQRIRYARNQEGHMLAYAITGNGPPLLRFPPPLTNDLEGEWNSPPERALLDRLSAEFQFLRFDSLGSGQSERIEPNFDFAAQADDTLAVADSAGFDQFAAWSISGGVLTAIHFAARYPERLSRLAIVGGYSDGRLRRGLPEAPEALKTMIAEGWGKPENAFATAFGTSYFPEGPLEDVRSFLRHMQVACPPEIMLKLRDAINSASVTHLLSKVRCPTLILHARGDAVHPLSEAQKLAAGIPDAELVILETANHLPYPGNTAWKPFIEAITDFLSG